jgi:hypothetical protein
MSRSTLILVVDAIRDWNLAHRSEIGEGIFHANNAPDPEI